MNKPFRALLLALLLIGVVAAGALWLGRSRGRDALTKYKAQLRAQGEKLSFAELGYPRPALTNDSLPQLLAAVERLKQSSFQPGLLALMQVTGSGRAESCWSGERPRFFSANATAAIDAMSWPEFVAIFRRVEPELADIRASLNDPPRYFELAPTNAFLLQCNPFVPKRNAAQWLSGDLVAALHEDQLARAQADLHVLTQLLQLHRDEPTLVNQMIRVAIAGLALADTWEALGAKGWPEEALASLQRDWERVDLIEAIEVALAGERTLGEEAITMLRAARAEERWSMIQQTAPPTQRTLRDYLNGWVIMPLWRLNADGDELFFLQHHQKCLDSVRKLQNGVAWSVVDGEMTNHFAILDKVTGHKLAAIKYWFSAMAIPNSRRAMQASVRAEMQRRLTVTAIALERYRLRHGRYPAGLAALMPEFLEAISVDLMDAKPLKYRLNADGTFTLYSVGEDGRDDGAEIGSTQMTSNLTLWSGKDAVWPIATNLREAR